MQKQPQVKVSAMVDRIRSTLSPERLAGADRMRAVNMRYIGLTRDAKIADELELFEDQIAAYDPNAPDVPDEKRILGIVGPSGTGKTRALVQHTRMRPTMQAWFDQYSYERRPLLWMNAPSPCSPLALGLEGLHALGYPVAKNIREKQAWILFRAQLKHYGVPFVVIDEAQHIIENASRPELAKISDALKNVVQMPDFPVRLILAGVEPLDKLLNLPQLKTRSKPIEFTPIGSEPPEDQYFEGDFGVTMLSTSVSDVIVKHAGLKRSGEIDDNLISRLLHASGRRFGVAIQLTRAAVRFAFHEGRGAVFRSHFELAYAASSGCAAQRNIFTLDNRWQEILPDEAFLAKRRDHDEPWETEHKIEQRFVAKRGERP
ncbi:ATP-binding protein [Rhizobium leguminosarum]|uniref:ATP-binding protein n=1 Tax=Rhizobium leguminosarum TaxID=384 RepID=UPI003F9C9F8B